MNKVDFVKAMRELPPIERGWKANRYALRCMAEHSDLRTFMRWPVLSATMVISPNAPYLGDEARTLIESPSWANHMDLCKTLPIGGGVPFGVYDATLLHQAYHLWQFEQVTGYSPACLDDIVEVGAGYGAMAVLLYGMGYRNKYTIVDLPELKLLQEYYISNVLGCVPCQWSDSAQCADLLIACYSLSEMMPELREPILSASYGAYLIAFQGWWGESDWECDNLKWFEQNLMQRHRNVYWTIKGNDYQAGHYYLIGVRK